MSSRRVLASIGALVVALACLAPSGGAAGGSPTLTRMPQSKVGRVEGTRAYVAVVFDGRRLRAYVCDGTLERPATISQWFERRWNGRKRTKLVRNGIALELEPVHADGSLTGRITAFSGPHRFRVVAAAKPAGLYDGTGIDGRGRASVRATWIVLADRTVRGAMIDPRPRKCRPVQVTLADGTTTIVTVCKIG